MTVPEPLKVRRAARTIASALVVDDLARKTAHALAEITGARRVLVSVESTGTSVFAEALASSGGVSVTVRHDPRSRRAAMPEGLKGSVEQSKAAITIHDVAAESSFRSDDYVARCAPRAALAVPALDADPGSTLLGLAYLESDREGAFEAAHVEAVELLMDLFAASLTNAKSYDAIAARLFDEHRELTEAVARGADVEQRLRAQERLASLGTIASGIAHEIKNPLNFINNFADISIDLAEELTRELGRLRGLLDPASASYLDEIAADLAQNVGKIHEHGKRADGIVKGMLAHARGRAGQHVDVDFNALVRDYATSAAQARQGAHALEVTLDPAVGRARVVPEELGRVILNLVSNALDATRARKAQLGDELSPVVRVSTRSLGDRVEVRVRDNGGGIPEAIRDRVYQPFFTTKPTGEGTGLGLPLSREIVVDRHGGEIAFETEEGESTEFVVTLPRRGAHPDSQAP